MRHMYYRPGNPAITPDELAELSLGHLDRPRTPSRAISRGPDGNAGVVFYALQKGHHEDAHLGYYPDRQTWQQIPNSPAWIGWYTDSPPTPADFARPDPVDGHPVTLGDGNVWIVPIARYVMGGTPLPRRLDYDGATWQAGAVLPNYANLWKVASDLWESCDGDDPDRVEFSLSTEADLAAMALGVNYLIGAAEISALGLFTTQTHQDVLAAVIDIPGLLRLKKKLIPPDEPSGSPGNTDDSQATPPASPTLQPSKEV